MGESKQPKPKLSRFTRNSIHHRKAILASTRCGCYYCCRTFEPSQIARWIDWDYEISRQPTPDNPGDTALCPYCGIDAVIGDALGAPITDVLLRRLNRSQFGGSGANGSGDASAD